ncbi:roadblock/LC7 domain-containing protein [Acinetobacter chinensis]
MNLMESRQVPEHISRLGKEHLTELLNSVSGINFVMLCTSDGFELALATKKNLENTGKIAAVSSSILAMVSAFIAEISLSGCNTITLDADNGKVVLTAVDHPQYPMAMVASASIDVLIGQLLFYMKKEAELLSRIK